MKIASELLREQMRKLQAHEKAWMKLPEEIQETPEVRRVFEVGETFYNYYDFYLGSMKEVITKIGTKIKQLDEQLLSKRGV
ncbi:MAG: hypothetical protein ACFFAU_18595 [Candidatus Hodarchaeota archaeon]